ncbi:hypothetical protein Gorai_006294 [Gossypium raimondii]|uniref:Methyltransferase small domain-containing protein n=2 Tax=Gossypium raimondii TaxID=29730 RepID=A0A7J8QFQ4_GOSRA|nr:hypothetical protein [Gossypium raimondii]
MDENVNFQEKAASAIPHFSINYRFNVNLIPTSWSNCLFDLSVSICFQVFGDQKFDVGCFHDLNMILVFIVMPGNSFEMSYKIAQIRLVSSHPEVYEPCDDSFALVDALLSDRNNLLELKPMLCMEVGCGSGYVITSLMLMLGEEANGAQFIATDINHHAIRVTQETMESHGVYAELINTDIASGLENRLAGSVDLLVVNPPYVPTPEDEVGREGIASAWAGGENGRSVIDKILPVAEKLLSKRGWLYMVTLTANNPSQICRQMMKKGYASKIVVQRSTVEESLHIIKFWKDNDIEADTNDTITNSKAVPLGIVDSVRSQIQRLSFWGSSDINTTTN